MASSFRSTCRAGRSSLSQLLHRRSQHQEQLSDQTSSFLVRFMSTGRLFVGGLSWETDESQLKDAFSSFGEVTDACIVMDKETGQSKGFGFVSFALPSHADAAVKTMDGRDLHGKTLRVNFAMNRPRGSGGFGGSGGAGGDYGGGRGGGYGGGGYGGYSDGGSTGGYGAGSYNGNAYATGPAGSYGGSATRNLYTESNKSFFNSGDFSNDTSANNPGKDSYSSSYDKRDMH